MRMEYGAFAWSMAHDVWHIRIEYGICAWSMRMESIKIFETIKILETMKIFEDN